LRALDEFMPEYEFVEHHRVRVAAPAEQIDRAVRGLTLADVPVARALMRLRGMRQRADRPILDEMAAAAPILEDVPGEGIVLAPSGQFWRLRGGDDGGPAAYAVIDFRARDGVLTTETRVHVEDAAARRSFRRYWRVIRPFSGLIRIVILRAAKRRAEAA
jgi:hypothetical protein